MNRLLSAVAVAAAIAGAAGAEVVEHPPTITTKLGLAMVRVEGGASDLGDEGVGLDPIPRHHAVVPTLYWSRFELTRGQFRQCASDAGIVDRYPELSQPVVEWSDALPMAKLSPDDAARFIAFASRIDGCAYRLPTEDEWEYAAHGGVSGPYWWGNASLEGMTVKNDNFVMDREPYHGLCPPGSYPVNPFGLYEILGNAWEIVAPNDGGKARIVRGGGLPSSVASCFDRGVNVPQWEHNGTIRVVSEQAPSAIAVASETAVLDVEPFRSAAKRSDVVHVPIADGVMLDLVPVPAGSFTMGSPAAEFGHGVTEGPLTTVHISHPFLIGRFEITQAQYRSVIDKNPSVHVGDDLPVDSVSITDAWRFTQKLTERERSAGRLGQDEVYRLPTEPEWEYACRAGTQTAYCFGDDASHLDEFAVYDRVEGPERVGSRLPNAWGIYDMHGNVAEWCWGTPQKLPGGEHTDPLRRPGGLYRTNPDCFSNLGPARAIRGGSWAVRPVGCRSAMRGIFDWHGASPFVGFRVIRCSTEVDVSSPDR